MFQLYISNELTLNWRTMMFRPGRRYYIKIRNMIQPVFCFRMITVSVSTSCVTLIDRNIETIGPLELV